MRIVHVVEPFASGISTFILQLSNHIQESHVVIYGIRQDTKVLEQIKKSFPSNTIFVEWSNAKREINFIYDIRASIELYRLLKIYKPDILHLHSSKAGVIGRVIGFILNINIVYTPNAISFLRTDVGKLQRRLYIGIEKLSNWFGGQVVSSSLDEQKAISIAKINSSLIHNGVDFSDYSFKKSKKFKIVTCGRITLQKNPMLFKEIAKMFEHNPDISFVWIGSGELEHKLNTPNIHITGWLDKENVKNELQEASLYISTSEWEGLSLATLEAMSIGLPLILRNKCGNTELIDGNKNGALFTDISEVTEKIQELSTNSEMLLKFSKASRIHYENNFTGKACAEKYFNETSHIDISYTF